MLNYLKMLFGKNNDNDYEIDLKKEINKMKKKKKVAEQDYLEIKEELDNTKNEIINLLKEKAEGFDKYLYYKNLCKEMKDNVKAYKSEISDLKRENKMLFEMLPKSKKEKILAEKEDKKEN